MLFRQYEKWAKENPYLKQDFVGKDGDEITRKFERSLSFVQFEAFLLKRLIINDLGDYAKNKDDRYADFAPIIRAIKTIIEADQFDGAVAGIYKENIIARKLGLADKQEARQVDKNGNDVPVGPTVSVIMPEGMNIEFPSNLTDDGTGG